VKSKNGKELKVGQEVVFAVRVGNSARLRWGTVERVTSRPETYGDPVTILKVRIDPECLKYERQGYPRSHEQRQVVTLEYGDRIFVSKDVELVASQPSDTLGFAAT
jgi:hypothetical protein